MPIRPNPKLPSRLPTVPFEGCPAKSDSSGRSSLTVLQHARFSVLVTRQLLARLGLLQLPSGVDFLAAAHDVGKVSPEFLWKHFPEWLAAKCPGMPPREQFKGPHSTVSQAAYEAWVNSWPTGAEARTWALVIGAHHGKTSAPWADKSAFYGGPLWSEQRRRLLDHLRTEFGPPPTTEAKPGLLQVAAGLVAVADWLASDEAFSEQAASSSSPEKEVAAHLTAAGWDWPPITPGLGFQELFADDDVDSPYPMQRKFHDVVDKPGVYVLEGPTGHGKTEAALWAAYRLMEAGHNCGLYFALPTRMTSDRIHERVAKFVRRAFGDNAGARLVHGQAWLKEFKKGGEELRPGGSWFAPRRRAILYPFGVGTIDQALMAVLPVRHAWVRWFALAGKVVILDEVHSYDLYTGVLLDKLIEALRAIGCTVLILSATLTRARRVQLLSPGMGEAQGGVTGDSPAPAASEAAYPLISGKVAGQSVSVPLDPVEPKTVKLRWTAADRDTVAQEAADRLAKGQSVLWIANTVEDAVACCGALRSACREGDRVGLLHARFPAWRREELEAEWLKLLGKGPRQGPMALVATQIAEQSVDVDADFLVTSIAPMDMLVQRMGRLWRHPRKNRPCAEPETLIACPSWREIADADSFRKALGGTAKVYAPYALWRTLRVLDGRAALKLPEEVRELLESTYFESCSGEPPWVAEMRDTLEKKRKELGARALGLATLALPAMDDDEDSCPTRDSSMPMAQALLVKGVDTLGSKANVVLSDGQELTVDSSLPDFVVAKALHRNLVRLPAYVLGRAPTPAWLKQHVWGAKVLQVDCEGRLKLDGNSFGYEYTDDLGAHRCPGQAHPTPAAGGAESEEWQDESDW